MHPGFPRLFAVARCCAILALAALLSPALFGQTSVTCNGLPATIVATAPGEIVGTQGDDVIVGTNGDDRIFGLAGNDTICALGGNDQISGGQGTDTLFGQAGNDTFFWVPGDSSDRVEGASESDILQVTGNGANETVELSANGNRLRLFRNVASIVLDVAGVERVRFAARGGTDLIAVSNLAGTGVQQVTLDLEGSENSGVSDGQPDSIAVFGRPGDDQISIAGAGNALMISGVGASIEIRNPEAALDTLSVQSLAGNDRITAEGLAAGLVSLTIEGGPGNDTITGSRASDALVGGPDNDVFVWAVGLPADRVGGEAGLDLLKVVGSAAADNVILSATAHGVQVVNTIDGATMEADVEQVTMQAVRGADQVTVNALSESALQKITVDLSPTATGTGGDGSTDTVIVNGTANADNITLIGSAGNLTLSGLAPTIQLQGSETARDTLTVNTGFEADILNAQGLSASVIRLVVRGGQGNDTLKGSLGDDLFTWAPGDSSDVIEGGAGNDTLQFNGSAIGENIGLTANGPRLRFTRDVASVVLDVNGVERVTFAAQGGADTVSFGDLSPTSVRQVLVNLGGPTSSSGDGQPDTIQITALTTNPIATVIGAGTMTMTWSPVSISVTGVEPALDRLILQTPTGAAPAVLSSLAGAVGSP